MSANRPWAGPSFERKSEMARRASSDTCLHVRHHRLGVVGDFPRPLVERVVIDQLADRPLAGTDAGDHLLGVSGNPVAVLGDRLDLRRDVFDQLVGIRAVISICFMVVSRSPLNFSTVMLTCAIVSLACCQQVGHRERLAARDGASGRQLGRPARCRWRCSRRMPPTSPSVCADAIESVRTSGVQVAPGPPSSRGIARRVSPAPGSRSLLRHSSRRRARSTPARPGPAWRTRCRPRTGPRTASAARRS